jgi:hypothetical protein
MGIVLSNPEFINKALEMFGPLLAGLLTPKDNGGGVEALDQEPGVQGAPQPQVTNPKAAEMIKALAPWLSKMNETNRTSLWSLLMAFSAMGADDMQLYLNNFLNLLQNGTAFRNTGSY